MKQEKISTNKILASTSLVFGILSLFSFRDCSVFYSVIIFFEYYSIKC